MNILIDIAHPAHVHLVKNTYLKLIKNGHNIFVTVKYVPSAIELLEKFEIPYIYIGGKKDSLIGKALLQINYNLKMWWLVISKKIDIGFGTSITIAHISRITKMHSIVLDDDDDDVEPLFVKYGHPFSDIVLSPKCVNRKSPKTIFYNSYHELAYLHPNCFTPNPAILNEIELKEGDCYFVVRFNSFKAHHDVGVAGLSMENKKKLIAYLESKGKVFITTEGAISDEFCKYQISISPEKIHSLIYYATMLIGDSQTMTSEASILGIPAIKCNSFAGKLSVPNELEERYHLCYSFAPEQFEQFVLKIEELLSKNSISLRDEFQLKRKRMLSEKLDITSFFVWFIENYPQSVYQTRNNSDLSSFL